MGKEKRRFVRLSVHHLAKYKLINDVTRSQTWVNARVFNMSAGGCCLLADESLSVGTVLEIAINFPHIDQPISTLAKIVWSKPPLKSNFYKCGVEFIQISDEMRQAIDGRIKSVYKEIDRNLTLTEKILKIILGGGEEMFKNIAKGVLVAAIIFVIYGLFMKLTAGVFPRNWLKITDTMLFFSIAISLLAK
jgi:hypothetical protein